MLNQLDLNIAQALPRGPPVPATAVVREKTLQRLKLERGCSSAARCNTKPSEICAAGSAFRMASASRAWLSPCAMKERIAGRREGLGPLQLRGLFLAVLLILHDFDSVEPTSCTVVA